MRKKLLVVSFIAFVLTGFGQCVQNLDFNTWSEAYYPANGNWSVQAGGSQVYQSANGDPSFYISPFDLMNVHITGTFRTNDGDNDWMGFVFSFLAPMTASDTFDCWLYDWKQEQQNAASSGMSLCRVNGFIAPTPGNDNPQFWDHTNSGSFTVVQNTFGGPGWVQGNNHNFELFLTYTRAIIVIDGQLTFDWEDCYKPGRFGFYNYSQRDCIYSNFNYELYIDFRYDDKVCQGGSAAFSFIDPCVTSMGQYQSLTWDFGDGTPPVVINNPTLATVNVTHTYTTPGIKNATLTVVDMTGCSATATHTVDVRAPITITPTLTPPLCNGGSNGNILATPTGGFGNYAYTWSNATNQQSLVGATAGTYTLTVTDGICHTTAQYTLNQPTALTATTAHTDAPCGSNGTATITVSGGTPPYSGVNFAGFPGTSGNPISMPAGTWIADFHDANGCSSLLQYTETVGALPCGITSSASKTNVTCFGGNNGTATLTVTTANPPQNITWSPGGGTGSTITGLTAGTYTYSYSDALPAHAFTGSVTITQPTAPMSVQLTTTPVACAGSSTGQATASVVSGGVTPYTYSWSGGHPNNPVASNLSAGPISVTVTDANGCTGSATGTVSSVPSLAVAMATVIDTCFHFSKGRATASVTGGNPPYSYAWSNSATDSANLNIIAGVYTLTVTDFNGCSITASATVGGPTASVTRTITSQNILCFGANTGAITVTPSGGTPGYTYTWSPNTLSGNNPTGLPAGFYAYTVTDALGCFVHGNDTLYQPASALSATSTHTNVSCSGGNNGTLTITLGGGVPPYNYQGNTVPPGTNTLSNLPAGIYGGTVTDANGCTATLADTITQPAPQSLTVNNTNEPCNGATSATASANFVNATGTVTYNWTGGLTGANLSNLAAGTYAVTATDANACVQNGSVTVTEPPAPVMTVTVVDAACYGGNGSATANPTGGTTPYTYTWSGGGGNNQVTTPPAGSYTVTAADAGGCNQTAAFTINQPTAIAVGIQQTDVKCFGDATGDITLTVSGGTGPAYTYAWSPNSGTTTPNATSLAAGTYNVTITDQAACTLDTFATINQPAAVLDATVASTDITCFGADDGTVTLTTTGGTTAYSYTWNPNVSTTNAATGLSPGAYDITVTDANLCTLTRSATISEPTQITSTQTQTDLVCYQVSTGDATLTVTGGTGAYTYNWSPNVSTTNSATTLAAGVYDVTIGDANSCTITATFTLTEPPQLTVSETHTNVLCFGTTTGDITLTAGGGTPSYTYQWNPNVSTGPTATGLAAGNFDITVSDANACTVTQNVVITEPPVLDVSAVETDAACFGESTGSITATGTGGVPPYNFTLSNGGTSASGLFGTLPANTYTVYVNDANACVDSTSITVNEPAQLTDVVTPVDVTCYHYTDGQITVATVGGTPAYTYTLNTGEQNSTGGFSNLAVGNYSITVTDVHNCSLTETAIINEPDSVSITVTPNPVTVNLGQTVQLATTTNQTGLVTYNWKPAFGLDCYDCASPVFSGNYSAIYTATVINANGCTGVYDIEVTVIPNYDIFIPNVFTPNGDGVNDTWTLFGNMEGIKQLSIKVFDRWGQKVYDSNDIHYAWDGRYKGDFLPPAVYVYEANFVWLNNHSDSNYKGTVTLIR